MSLMYTQQELNILLEGVNSGTDLSGLVERLGRTESGLAQKLQKLLRKDPDTWDRGRVNVVLKEVHSRSWISAKEDPDKVKQGRQQVDTYLLEHPDATARDLKNAGLTYAMWIGYRHRLNFARDRLGLKGYGRGQKRPPIEQIKPELISYIQDHPDAMMGDLRRGVNGFDASIVGVDIHSLRREAGIVPDGHILATEAATRLNKLRGSISYLFQTGKLEGVRIGDNMYISEASVEDRLKTHLVVVQQ